MLHLSVASCSRRGGRAANEDRVADGVAGRTRYALLADGAGGHQRGADAARLAVARIQAELVAARADFGPTRLAAALQAAHRTLQADQEEARGQGRMHTTVVALWIDTETDMAVWAHVGDSRIYRFRYGAAAQLTRDDSVLQDMLDGGVLTPLQARDHPLKSQLVAALGMRGDVDPHTSAVPEALQDGDAYLLCSDGWWSALRIADVASLLADAATPEEWLETMAARIEFEAGPGLDNFSAVAVWVDDPAESTLSMEDDVCGSVSG